MAECEETPSTSAEDLFSLSLAQFVMETDLGPLLDLEFPDGLEIPEENPTLETAPCPAQQKMSEGRKAELQRLKDKNKNRNTQKSTISWVKKFEKWLE